VLESDYPTIEVIVVDDASDTADGDLPKAFPNVRFYRNTSRSLLSFSRNRGATLTTGDILFFIDDDNVIAYDSISKMLGSFRKSESVGVVSPVIYRDDAHDSVWSSYVVKGRFPGFYILGTQAPGVEVDTFSFHDAFMVRRDVFDECGGFDPVNFPIHFSELDFAYRLHRSGYRARVNPDARVWHDSGTSHMHVDSVRAYYTLRNRVILLKRYGTRADQVLYVFGILPPLTLYYLVHHIKYSEGSRRLTIYNLLWGVVAGLAYREHPQPSPPLNPAPVTDIRSLN
jgi:GT2 family glycosyltransferase